MVNVTADYPGSNGELMMCYNSFSVEWCSMKYMTLWNDKKLSIQVVFNLGTDPNQAAINVQNRVASVVNKLPPLVVREGVKITREVPSMLMYVNLLVRIKIQIKSFYTIMQISMSYLN
jgi:HAE1 family hydrophobic/amphiphilic exporter-1